MGFLSDFERPQLLRAAVKRFDNLRGFYNLNLVQLRRS